MNKTLLLSTIFSAPLLTGCFSKDNTHDFDIMEAYEIEVEEIAKQVCALPEKLNMAIEHDIYSPNSRGWYSRENMEFYAYADLPLYETCQKAYFNARNEFFNSRNKTFQKDGDYLIAKSSNNLSTVFHLKDIVTVTYAENQFMKTIPDIPFHFVKYTLRDGSIHFQRYNTIDEAMSFLTLIEHNKPFLKAKQEL